MPKADYAGFMVSACNFHADRLRQQGLSNSQIFGQDRSYKIAVWGGLEYEMSSLAGAIVPGEVLSWNGYPQVTLTCQRDDSLDTPAAAVVSRSEEHTSELQSLMRTSSAVFRLHKKKTCAELEK